MEPFGVTTAGLSLLSILNVSHAGQPTGSIETPHLLYIYSDDIWYGDVSALNPEGKIPTPKYRSMESQKRHRVYRTESPLQTPG